MYNIKSKVIGNEEPWIIPCSQRVELVYNALKQKKKIALYLYGKADNSTFRYRGYNVMQACKKSNMWGAMYFFEDELINVLNLIPLSSLFILIRCSWTINIDDMINCARKNNIKVVFDIDDLVCDVNYLPLLTNTLNVDYSHPNAYDFWFAYVSRIEFVASKADAFIVTNDYLGEKLKSKFRKPYYIIRNSINQEQIDMSIYSLANKKNPDKNFHIGYFSGTPSHINDFNTISNELVQLLDDYSNMKLQVVGYMEFPEKLNRLLDSGKITFHPFVSFIELQRLIAQVDVNIVPLVNNIFTNCKSELKYFEAAIVNTPTIATPTYTYKNAIIHGENGFLANQGEWYDIIRDIYNNKYDMSSILKNAYEHSINTYCGDRFLGEVESVYTDLFALEDE